MAKPLGRPMLADRVQAAKNIAFNRARSQARYRGEIWELTKEQWQEIWGDLWNLRGKNSNNYCMAKIDPDLGWTVQNSEIVLRSEFVRTQKIAEGKKKGRVKKNANTQ